MSGPTRDEPLERHLDSKTLFQVRNIFIIGLQSFVFTVTGADMCARFTQRADSKKLAKEFKVAEVPAVEARFNIAPTQDILAVRGSGDGRAATFYKWGLIPSWAKDTSMGAGLVERAALNSE